jgi:peroxiredoxin
MNTAITFKNIALTGVAIILLGLLAAGCSGVHQKMDNDSDYRMTVPSSAMDIQPIKNGDVLPKIVLRTTENKRFDLNKAVAEKPSVLIFYRGGWCPYCNVQLGQLQTIEADLVALGYQVIAVSPDRPAKLNESIDKHKLGYTLLSDSKMSASRAMGISFMVEDALVSKYKTSYGIDLEGDSGETHHQLPVPSVFIVGQDGIIHFTHVDSDYKTRIAPADLLAAAKTALK